MANSAPATDNHVQGPVRLACSSSRCARVDPPLDDHVAARSHHVIPPSFGVQHGGVAGRPLPPTATMVTADEPQTKNEAHVSARGVTTLCRWKFDSGAHLHEGAEQVGGSPPLRRAAGFEPDDVERREL